MWKSGKTSVVLAVLFSCLAALPATAQRIDLSSWSATTVLLPEHPDLGDWILFDGNTNVIQALNSSPTFFCNNQNGTSYTMIGTLLVGDYADDDLIGFAFGYQDPGHCYILDWKQGTQDADGSVREEGFLVRKMHGDPAAMVWTDYWGQHAGAERFTILDSHLGEGTGWQPSTVYDFNLFFDSGSFVLSVHEGDTEVWSTVVDDGTYASGQFAFYCFSQSGVVYAGFTEYPVATEQLSLSGVKALFR